MLGLFKKLSSHYHACLAMIHKMLFQSEAMSMALNNANCGAFSRGLHTLPYVSDLLYTVGIGAPTAGATDVKAGKPDPEQRD